jgi:hypothetical protein
MALFSPWFLIGFVLGAIAGTLATDLTREEVLRSEGFKSTLRFWTWSRQQSLVVVAVLWAALLLFVVVFALWSATRDWWKYLVIGSVIGGAAAPWIWLHFVRHFGTPSEREAPGREALIIARAHMIWLEQGQPPAGHEDEHYTAAKKELEDSEERVIETSAKSAEQQLARYRLVSILLGIALLVATLVPTLQDWLPRAQQVQAFGVSLTLIAGQQRGEGRGTTPVNYDAPHQGGDRLSDATMEAHQIGAASLDSPITLLKQIGPDLKDFANLSMIDRDRAFIAWMTYELPGNMRQVRNIQKLNADDATLITYIKNAENFQQNSYYKRRWEDPSADQDFAAGSSIISNCLHDYATEVHDPHFFTIIVGRFLRTFVQEVKNGPSPEQIVAPFDFPGYLGNPLEWPYNEPICNLGSYKWGEVDLPSQPSTNPKLNISPYPSLIAAYYLAAIGAVDTGVLVIEDWIKLFGDRHQVFVPEAEPQIAWYLLRAKLSATSLPYQFGGLVVPHRQLVN